VKRRASEREAVGATRHSLSTRSFRFGAPGSCFKNCQVKCRRRNRYSTRCGAQSELSESGAASAAAAAGARRRRGCCAWIKRRAQPSRHAARGSGPGLGPN
jgi:hypothetical protein